MYSKLVLVTSHFNSTGDQDIKFIVLPVLCFLFRHKHFLKLLSASPRTIFIFSLLVSERVDVNPAGNTGTHASALTIK